MKVIDVWPQSQPQSDGCLIRIKMIRGNVRLPPHHLGRVPYLRVVLCILNEPKAALMPTMGVFRSARSGGTVLLALLGHST